MSAAGVSVSLDEAGTMTVSGSSGADVISVVEAGGVVTVSSGGVALGTYAPARRVLIDGGNGRDTITFVGDSMGAEIYGGDGADVITVTDPAAGGTGERAASIVYGGAGPDQITVTSGVGTAVHGGSGGDRISADGGQDLQLLGSEDGKDTVTLASAVCDATVYAGDGDKVNDEGTRTKIVSV